MLDELDEHATGRARVDEGHKAFGTSPRRPIDELDALPHQAVKRPGKVDDLEAEVMHRGAPALGEEARDARVLVGRLEKLDAGVTAGREDDLHLLVGHVVDGTDRVPQDVAIEGQRIRDERDDHTDVMEWPSAGQAAHRLPGS
jgi:hypothetical protein